jgi:alginate O-acetyltransferase complex protein AlgI
LWRRWHISLSSWLRDYLYISLGGNRISVSRTYVNLMLTMLLGGLWHGAAWTFVFWGFLHGAFLVIERLVKGVVRVKADVGITGVLAALLTFGCVNITWVFFRAGDFSEALRVLSSMFFLGGGKPMLTTNALVVVYGVMTAVFLGHYAMRHSSLLRVIERVPAWLLVVGWGFMIFGLFIVQTNGDQFIYFQF